MNALQSHPRAPFKEITRSPIAEACDRMLYEAAEQGLSVRFATEQGSLQAACRDNTLARQTALHLTLPRVRAWETSHLGIDLAPHALHGV